MPYGPTGIYTLPPIYLAIPGTVIIAAQHNSPLEDLGNANNFPRPIVAGGTGATNITSAQQSLSVDGRVVFSQKDAAYTAIPTDNNSTMSFSADVTLALTSVTVLKPNWHMTVIAKGGNVTIDPYGDEMINGAATLVVPKGSECTIYATSSTFFGFLVPIYVAPDPWSFQPLGTLIAANMGVGGFVPPPKDNEAYRYIVLTAGQIAAGGYNEGCLDSELVDGTAPTINATARIILPGSPFLNQSLRLINTERRFLRAGSPGLLQDSQFGSHSHPYSDPGHVHPGVQNSTQSTGRSTNTDQPPAVFSYGNSGVGYTNITIRESGGDETRSRNIGVDYYMRIK